MLLDSFKRLLSSKTIRGYLISGINHYHEGVGLQEREIVIQ